MSYQLADRWIWDFWLVSDGPQHHLFYLQAPKSIGDPEERHWNVSIGHAVSRDLTHWEQLDDALGPGPVGSFDDFTVWTGSIERSAGQWLMAYTGTSHAENGRVQRIGFATSPDLHRWDRCEDIPVFAADPHRYETLADTAWHDEAWRDPWLFRDPEDEHFHLLFTARVNHGERFARGVVGHARSLDLKQWQHCDAIARPGDFGQMEVPQLLHLSDRWYLLFASDTPTQGPERRSLATGTGTYYMVADNPFGPFKMIGNGVLDADQIGSTYAGRVHEVDGTPWYLAWRRSSADGTFIGELDNPRKLSVRPDGSLALAARSVR